MLISTMGGSFLQQIMKLFVIITKSTSITYETNFQENDSLRRLSTLFDGTSD